MFSRDTTSLLSHHSWPGNVREIRGVVDAGYFLSDGESINPEHVHGELDVSGHHEPGAPHIAIGPSASGGAPSNQYAALIARWERMRAGGETFWEVVHEPFMERELNRDECRYIVAHGLREAMGSYKRLLGPFHISPGDYLRFMDFLRHHRLKP